MNFIPRFLNNLIFPADYGFISAPKSGRTWVRCLINHYYYLLYPLSVTSRNYLYTNKVPLIHFEHANYDHALNPAKVKKRVEKLYRRYNKNIILFRNPRDVLNSYYHHVVHGKHYPNQDKKWKDMTISQFIRSEYGIERIVLHMITVFKRIKPERTLIIYYEQLKKNPEKQLSEILSFLECKIIDEKVIKDSVKYNNIDNMRKREKDKIADEFQVSLRNRKTDDDRGLKAREGVVGGYKKVITNKDDLNFIEKKCGIMKGTLDRYLENYK